MERRIRVVVAKPGLDGHDRGAKIIARALRDSVPADDVVELKALGVAEVFTPGASTDAIVDFIRGAAGSPAAA